MEIILFVLVITVIFIIYEFNKFVTLKNKLKQSKSSIDVYLNQRFDLIPNLVEVVKGYAKYEESVFSKVAEMRSAYDKDKDLKKGAELSNECNNLFALAESMPDIKANEQFLSLQKTLEKTEDNLQAARRLYNGDVTLYNTTIATFPNNIFSNLFNFQEEPLFEIDEYKRVNIKVDL